MVRASRPAGSSTRSRRALARLVASTAIAGLLLSALWAPAASAATGTYTNPLTLSIPGDGVAQSCADPDVIHAGSATHVTWYLYCTTDPLNDNDRNAAGDLNFHYIPMYSSTDLVHWTYRGDAFPAQPSWVGSRAGLWAPDVELFNGVYHLYYTASETVGNSSAIGVATGPTPLGPWTDSGSPVVGPLPGGQWAFDPEIVTNTDGSRWIFFGSYYGGIRARQLDPTGMHSLEATQTQITIDNRYEGAEVVKRGDWYYLFASASNCCAGPLTGYGVFVGRSASPLGPYIDKEGVSLLDEKVGGTPVIYQNGNRWVGPGHNTVFQDFSGQWWSIYHAVDVNHPYFRDAIGFTKRPALLDAIDWVGGWPTLNGGRGPSDTPQAAPAAQPGQTTSHQVRLVQPDLLGPRIASRSDEFNGTSLGSQWSWIREPNGTEAGGLLTMRIQHADLFEDSNNASVLVENAPLGDYAVEAKVRINLPPGCCYNYSQAGLVIYGDDNNFIKLVEFSNWNTRQTEFAKEVFPIPAGYHQRYGNMVVGPAGDWTWLRIVKRASGEHTPSGPYGGNELYTAYTSHDGIHWSRGGTWTHHLGPNARIGLVAMGIQDDRQFTADIDYVRVSRVYR
ncbi:MAG TPA: family 43 glycosylhydrolase [Candidatus Limnocylindrales bacterium]